MSTHPPLPHRGDCDAAPGELHHRGCDVEQCPLCRGQMMTCDCVYRVNQLDPKTLDQLHPAIYTDGPTPEMFARYDDAIEAHGGRLTWTGAWPET